jgi:peroxin-16
MMLNWLLKRVSIPPDVPPSFPLTFFLFVDWLVYSGLNLIGLYHNSILRRAANQAIESADISGIDESQFNKYTRFWTTQSGTHRMISKILSVIAYTQILMEMGILRKGYRGKRHYQWVAGLEGIK